MERLEPVQGINVFDPSQDPAISAAAGMDTNLLRGEVGLPTKEEDALAELKAQLAALQSKSRSALPEDVMEYLKPKPYDKNLQSYKDKLSGLYEPSPRPSLYDLATELGRAMLSSDPTAGAFTSMGAGFVNFSDRLKKSDAEDLKARRAVGLEAAKLAMEDERKAEERLKDFAIEIYQNQNLSDVDPITLQYDEMDEEGNFTGQKVTRSFDKKSDAEKILKILRTQNGVDIEALPDPTGATEVDKLLAREFAAEYKKIAELGGTVGYGKLDTIDQARLLAEKIGPDGFGKANEWTMPIRQFVLDAAPWAAKMAGIDESEVASQEALSALTISFVLANVAQTKGAVSNAEMGLFKEASPYLGQTYGGFMLALQVQELAAQKAIDFSRAYKAEASKYLSENPTDQGRGVQNHMGEWAAAWQDSARSSFLNDDMKASIARFKAEGEARIGSGVFDIKSYEQKQREFSQRTSAQNQALVNQEILTKQGLIDQIMNDPDLNSEQKLEQIRKIRDI